MEPTFFETPAQFRAWLQKHHSAESELWVGFYKKGSGRPSITWPEAVDEALCFGWIDGVRKSVDADAYTNRFTPRRPKSIWSAVNIQRVAELTALGLMHPSGLKAFNERDPTKAGLYSFERGDQELDEPYQEQFRANPEAWSFFQAQPPGYRKTASWWVMSAKREETRQKRLATLIADSEQRRRVGAVVGR